MCDVVVVIAVNEKALWKRCALLQVQMSAFFSALRYRMGAIIIGIKYLSLPYQTLYGRTIRVYKYARYADACNIAFDSLLPQRIVLNLPEEDRRQHAGILAETLRSKH